jgi:hypothetical protein
MSEQATALSERDLRVIDGDARVLDLRLAERLGFERSYVIRQLIDRNADELRRYGELIVRTVQTIGPGRPGQEYWLNEAQLILVSMKSDTNRAADVREEVIKVFLAWRHGTPTPAVPTMDKIEGLFDRQWTLQQKMHDNVVYIRKRVDDLVPRYDFSKQIRKLWLYVIVQRYDNLCPCGCGTQIVRDGEPIRGVWEDDHWYSRERNGSSEGWPVAHDCNQALRDPTYRESKVQEFQFFHKNLEWLTSKAIPTSNTIKQSRASVFEQPKYIDWKPPKDLFDL